MLDCFHPEGGTVIGGSGKWDCDPGPDDELACSVCQILVETGSNARFSGRVDYAGVISRKRYRLAFDIETKMVKRQKSLQVFTRVTPTGDTAPVAPNSTCWMRDWTLWHEHTD